MKDDFQNSGEGKRVGGRTAELLLSGELPVPAADQWSLLAEIPRVKAGLRLAAQNSPDVPPASGSSSPQA